MIKYNRNAWACLGCALMCFTGLLLTHKLEFMLTALTFVAASFICDSVTRAADKIKDK